LPQKLQSLLDSYPPWSLQHKSCEFLLSNTSAEDISSLDPDSLKANIDSAIATWEQVSWRKEYSDRQFMEYVLPFRIAREPAEFYWRWNIPQWLRIETSDDMMEMARQINLRTSVNMSPDSWSNRQMGYTATLAGNVGKCDDRAILTVMAMRAYGIPAALESVPQWGSHDVGHAVCSVIRPDGSKNASDRKNVFLTQKAPKIYRRMCSLQTQSILYKYRNSESMPPVFSDFKLMDVTPLHNVGQRDLPVPVTDRHSHIVYLSVFKSTASDRWNPVAYTLNRGRRTVFSAAGDGTIGNKGDRFDLGEDIGDGILYLPSFYIDDEVVPIGCPMVVFHEGVREIKPGKATESVVLRRKYPRLKRIVGFADKMVGGMIQGANRADFSDAVTLHFITTSPLSRPQQVVVEGKFRYVRYFKPNGTLSIAELGAYDQNGKRIASHAVVSPALTSVGQPADICDNDPLTYFEMEHGLNLWVGIEFDRPQKLSQIEFCPRTDDNDISPGDSYELLYWDDQWRSLSEKQADGFEIAFDEVPRGALLLLRDLTKGHEERPFTYENNRQVWW